MDAHEFMQKWLLADLTESSGSHQHFCDLCDLLDHPKPADADPKGEWFTFEKGATKTSGGNGWADVWKKDHFAWEYKGNHKDLDAAYNQLLEYHEALENPPLLVVSDMERIVVYTKFNNTPTVRHEIERLRFAEAPSLELLRNVFYHPDKLRPGSTIQAITADAAERIAEIAQSMRDRELDPPQVAHFLDRIVFCLFAEDIDLLPAGLFSRLVDNSHDKPEIFHQMLGQLFDTMADGGIFGVDTIPHFNGSLFAGGPVLQMTADEIDRVHQAARLDWSAVDPSIFGTLFERGMDPAKRSQIGAHYTSRQDIEILVEPVVMWPLRREWEGARQVVENLLTTGQKKGKKSAKPPTGAPTGAALEKARDESERLVRRFHDRLTQVKVLDPACGSGNFLYVTLQKLKDLEKEVIVFAQDSGLEIGAARVGPWQLYGIEVSPYAHDLAQMVVWIGYLQWVKANGFGAPAEPILKPMESNFLRMDAILDLTDPDDPKEPEWPKVDYIVGNPPFLGTKKLRSGLGDAYVDRLFVLYGQRLPNFSDLCCYWFEKARMHIQAGGCRRAGLLATQGIRGGLNRTVLNRILATGSVFFAESDRPWVLDGAQVHVSMIGFDDGQEDVRRLDGRAVGTINANLTSGPDVTQAGRLPENATTAFIGDVKSGSFDLPDEEARSLLYSPNPSGRPNSEVLVPWVNGLDVLRRPRFCWIIDFGSDMTEGEAALFERPFRLVEERVKPKRLLVKRRRYRELWWLHAEPCAKMRAQVQALDRFIGTPTVSKHRVFGWLSGPTLADHQLCVFARSDDYFFGVLHSRLHEVWARAQGTQLRERESGFRYTPTTCFETFPFPWPPGSEPEGGPLAEAIAVAARELNELRERWLNPPEWTREEVLEFPGSVDGPWARYVHDPDDRGVGTVRYPRRVDSGLMPSLLRKRTLTNLYNLMPTWLGNAHRKLDEAVCAAYAATTGDGAWLPDMADEEILEKLLALNLARSAAEGGVD